MALVALLVCTASTARAAGEVDRVDRAIAVVGDRVITATEVDIAVTLASHDVSPEPVLDPGGQSAEQWWIEQVELRELAGDVSVYRPQTGEIRDRLNRLLASFDPADLADTQARLGLDRSAMSTWVYSRLVVERFVYRNVGLAAAAANEDAAATRQRYRTWLSDLSTTIAVRRIAPVQRR